MRQTFATGSVTAVALNDVGVMKIHGCNGSRNIMDSSHNILGLLIPAGYKGRVTAIGFALSGRNTAGSHVGTLYINGLPTTKTCTVGTNAFHALDESTADVRVVGGDYLTMYFENNGATLLAPQRAFVTLEGDVPDQWILAGTTAQTNTFATPNQYISVLQPYQQNSNIGLVQNVMPTSFTIISASYKNDTALGAEESIYYSLYKNSAEQASTGVTTVDDTMTSVTGLSVSVVALDKLAVRGQLAPFDGISATGTAFSFLCQAATPGEYVIGGNSTDLLNNTGTTEYINICSDAGNIWRSTLENTLSAGFGRKCVLSKLAVRLTNTPAGAGKSYTFKVRKNLADSGLTTTITDTGLESQDTTNSVGVSFLDYINMSSVSANTPSTRAASWSIVATDDVTTSHFIGISSITV